uniref:Uncharacterized protein n=1 Tax=Odontella aurita TaxID=265563 RepID=A0A7S4N1Z6_9STRA|mmetsp:Transcript_44702/g.136377  ORF Transcript_44702/g.136377 Transcript_44702/m.136377 type:complete len:618 (+) Transcript_44702:311-2164(+)
MSLASKTTTSVAATIAAAAALAGQVDAWVNPSGYSSRTAVTRAVRLDGSAEAAIARQEEPAASSPLSRFGHDHEAWKNGYSTCPVEVSPTVLDLPDLPGDFPAGTYYRNGHACFESDDGVQCLHMFDGDGMVVGATFYPEEKKVLFRNRFVRTDGFVSDKADGVMSRPGIFGTKVSGGFWKNIFRLDFKNVANTNVLHRGGKLYALWEGGWPYILDPLTLENDEVAEPAGHSLGGLLAEGEGFAAHYRHDARTGNLISFGYQLDPIAGNTKIDLWEFDGNMQRIRKDDVSFLFPGAGVMHDFCITENWHIFVTPPAAVDQNKALGALFGQGAFADVIGFDQEATESIIYLVPRSKHLDVGTASEMKAGEDKRVRAIPVPYHFSFHFANAFEDESGNVVVDTVLTDEVDLGLEYDKSMPVWEAVDFDQLSPSRYVRMTFDPAAGESGGVDPPAVVESIAMQTVSIREPEFPTVPVALSGKRHRYAYTVGAHRDVDPPPPGGKGKGAAGSVLKVDAEDPAGTEAFAFLPHEFVGEPIFCPKAGADASQPECEDRGYVVTFVTNGRDLTTDMVIFDVEGKGALEKGPVARLPMPTYIPPGLHGTFVDGLTFDMRGLAMEE